MGNTLQHGLTHTLTYTVPSERTVPHLLPASPRFVELPQVLATGYLVGIVEWACMECAHPHLDDTETTLGVHIDLTHEAPTVPGGTVRVEVTLTEVEGRALAFDIHAYDDNGVIGRGSHRRGIIDASRFDERLSRLASTVDRQHR